MHHEHDADDDAHEGFGDRQRILVESGQSRIHQFRLAIGHGASLLIFAPHDRRHRPTLTDGNNTEGRKIYSSTRACLRRSMCVKYQSILRLSTVTTLAPAPVE